MKLRTHQSTACVTPCDLVGASVAIFLLSPPRCRLLGGGVGVGIDVEREEEREMCEDEVLSVVRVHVC